MKMQTASVSLSLWDEPAGGSGPVEHSTVHVGNLTQYPPAVALGIRRLLKQFDFAGQPAFAIGRRLYSPNGINMIGNDGLPFRPACPIPNFHCRAMEAAIKMETYDTYSFNSTYAKRYLK